MSRLDEIKENVNAIESFIKAQLSDEEILISPDIDWRTRDGKKATEDDLWAWAFASDRNGEPYPWLENILDAIEKSYAGYIEVDGFAYKMSGNKFLQRSKIK